MPRLRKYIMIAVSLQLLTVAIGLLISPVWEVSGLFGMGIPLVVAWLYAVRQNLSLKESSAGGLWIGAVSAAAALLIAIPLSGNPWALLPLGTVASAATGWLGAFLGWALPGQKERRED
jgi:hypothetical protein